MRFEGGYGVAGKRLEDIPRACVIGRDHAILPRNLIVDLSFSARLYDRTLR